MVYTVTFNPALDYIVRVRDFRVGETNRAGSDELQWGGKGINVSTVLRNLGVENVALGFLAGFTGRALDQGLRDAGVRTDFIWLEEGLTRVNVKIKAEQETEINGAGPAIPAAALEELFARLDRLRSGDVLVLAGSIPASLPSDVYQRILARLADREILTAVDGHRAVFIAQNGIDLLRVLAGDKAQRIAVVAADAVSDVASFAIADADHFAAGEVAADDFDPFWQ